jgi:Tfp pilus assembly protein PilF
MNFFEKIKTLQNFYESKNYKKAIEGCRILIKKLPKNSFILNLMGMSYQGLIRHNEAINCFELALKADNKNIAAMNNLANSFKHLEQFEIADELYKKILQIDPNYINAYNNYANLKSTVNDIEGSLTLYDKAIDIAKKKNLNPIQFLLHKAGALQSLNRKNDTLKIIDQIIKIDHDNEKAHKILSSVYKYSKEESSSISHINHMENIFKKKDLSDFEKGTISFALGKAYEDLKETEKAIKFIISGNEFYKKIRKSNIVEHINIMSQVENVFQEIDLNKIQKFSSNKRIIFICGMPRSGTTLVEQIISSHKKVYGAGELSFLSSVIYKNLFLESKLDKKKIINHQNSSVNSIHQQYFDRLSLFNIKEHIMTDKAPFNFKWLGIIKIFFPNSKIVYCKRNPQDNCLSIYKNKFASSLMNWSYSQKDVATYYNNHCKLMNFWLIKIPEFIHTIEYEKIVSDKENEIKKLLNFCELEMDENCFNHHKNNKTPIKTVSISQAREPVYNTSINSSHVYKNYLHEMFENLI